MVSDKDAGGRQAQAVVTEYQPAVSASGFFSDINSLSKHVLPLMAVVASSTIHRDLAHAGAPTCMCTEMVTLRREYKHCYLSSILFHEI